MPEWENPSGWIFNQYGILCILSQALWVKSPSQCARWRQTVYTPHWRWQTSVALAVWKGWANYRYGTSSIWTHSTPVCTEIPPHLSSPSGCPPDTGNTLAFRFTVIVVIIVVRCLSQPWCFKPPAVFDAVLLSLPQPWWILTSAQLRWAQSPPVFCSCSRTREVFL